MPISCINPLFSSFSTHLLPGQVSFGATLDPFNDFIDGLPPVSNFDMGGPMVSPESLETYCSINPDVMNSRIPFSAEECSKTALDHDGSHVLLLMCQFLFQYDFQADIVNVFENLMLLFITYEYSVGLLILGDEGSLLNCLVSVLAQTQLRLFFLHQHLTF